MIGQYSIISSLQNELKTGNIFFDIALGLIIAKLIEQLFQTNIVFNLTRIRDFIENFTFRSVKGKVIITIPANEADGKTGRINILQAINNIIKKNQNKIKTIHYQNNAETFNISSLNNTLLSDDIYVQIRSEDIEKKKDDIIITRQTIYYITLKSYTLKAIDIEIKLNEWVKLWKQENNHKPAQITTNVQSSRDFKSFKTFDNLFFEGKEDLIKLINRFQTKVDDYKRIGKPYTLGILLYGECGCGKTSILKAIANMLKKDVHNIHIDKKETLTEFMSKWNHSLKINAFKNESLSEKIIHLPEIDYLSDLFLSDEEIKNNNTYTNKQTTDDKQPIIINIDKDKNKEDLKVNHLTKAFFRELFDGVDEQHGRIIVMTTNNIDRLDPLIFRDGRIDIKLKLGKMTYKYLKQYLEFIFETKLDDSIRLPDEKFTPAKIQSVAEHCLSINKNIYECIDILNNCEC